MLDTLRYESVLVSDTQTNAWGTPKVSNDFSLVHGLFTFDVPASQWLLYENGTEVSSFTAATSSGGLLSLSSNGNTSYLQHRRHARYQPNRGMLWSASMVFPSPNGDGVRDFGMVGDDGVFFRLKPVDGVGTLHAVRMKAGVIQQEVAIDMPFTIDYSKGNIYDIQMQWRGVGNIKFFVGNPDTGVPQLVHEFKLLNTLTALSTADAAMCVGFRATNTTEDVIIQCGCVDLTSEGGTKDKEEYASAYAEGVSISTDTPVIVVRQPATISGKFNSRDVRLARITVQCDKKAVFKVWTTRNATTITGATFKPVNNGSFVETDSISMNPTAVRATSVTTANMKFITAIPVLALNREETTNPAPDTIQFFLVQGDYLVVTGTAPSGNAEVVVEWGEEI